MSRVQQDVVDTCIVNIFIYPLLAFFGPLMKSRRMFRFSYFSRHMIKSRQFFCFSRNHVHFCLKLNRIAVSSNNILFNFHSLRSRRWKGASRLTRGHTARWPVNAAATVSTPSLWLLTFEYIYIYIYIYIYVCIHTLTYLLTYLSTYLLRGAESLLKS